MKAQIVYNYKNLNIKYNSVVYSLNYIHEKQ